jgi:hypothetical protein
MTWQPIRDAAAQGKASMATWKRRVAGGWPSYLEADDQGGPGVRMVWVGSIPTELLGDEVAKLRGMIETLVERVVGLEEATTTRRAQPRSPRQHRSLPRPAAASSTPDRGGATGRAEVRAANTAAPVRPVSGPTHASADSRSKRRSPAAAISEAEVEAILAHVEAHSMGEKAIQRKLGIASNFVYLAKRGKKRTAKALPAWEKLRGFLSQPAKRAA